MVALLAVILLACSDDQTTPSDAASDATDDGAVPFTLSPGDKGHADVGAVLGTGKVRAGQVTATSQLLAGAKVEGKVGDFKIYNSRAAFIIEGVRPSDGSAPYGGEVLDAARLDRGSPVSLLGEVVIGLGIYILQPTSVGVVQDGSDGTEAVVRVIGEPVIFPSLGAVLGTSFGDRPQVHMVLDYALKPGSSALEIRLRAFNKTRAQISLPLIIVSVSAGDGVEFFAEGKGFDVSVSSARDNIAAAGPAVSYALFSPQLKLAPVIHVEGLWIHTVDGFSVPAAGEAQQQYHLAVAGPDPEGLLRGLRELRGEQEPPEVTGKVVDPAGKPVPDVRVHAEAGGASAQYVTMARADAKGEFSLALRPGSYRLSAVAEGRASLRDVALDVAGKPVTKDLTVGGSSVVQYTVTDGSGAPLPARLTFQAATAPASLPASFGEPVYPGDATLIRFSASGQGTAPLPPGSYTVTASRGFEYEIGKAAVTLADTDSKSVSLQLSRSVDSTGFLCGDFHLHGLFSPDCSEAYTDKVAALAGEGVEIAVISEHDYIGDLGPAVKALGLQGRLLPIMGQEVTTFSYGHFNTFALEQDPTRSNQGAVVWTDKTPQTLFAAIRSDWPAALIQVNHPRFTSGYFKSVSYQPGTGQADKQSMWSTNFDALEVFNGKRLEPGMVWTDPAEGAVLDWFSLLDRGLRVAATGNSDSHDVLRDVVGYPRNCVKLSTDDPGKLAPADLVAAIKQQRVVVSGGPLVSVELGGKGLGDLAPFAAKTGALKVKVQAPTWMSADTLRVIVGGTQVHKLALDASTADPQNPVIRYDDSLTIQAQQDSWVIVVVTGEGTLAPVAPDAQPFALSNPIYLDVDGNGKFDPPLSF